MKSDEQYIIDAATDCYEKNNEKRKKRKKGEKE